MSVATVKVSVVCTLCPRGDELMKENTDWINSCITRGLTIYDCGPAPERANFPGITSPFYQMETDQIAAREYQNYVRLGR